MAEPTARELAREFFDKVRAVPNITQREIRRLRDERYSEIREARSKRVADSFESNVEFILLGMEHQKELEQEERRRNPIAINVTNSQNTNLNFGASQQGVTQSSVVASDQTPEVASKPPRKWPTTFPWWVLCVIATLAVPALYGILKLIPSPEWKLVAAGSIGVGAILLTHNPAHRYRRWIAYVLFALCAPRLGGVALQIDKLRSSLGTFGVDVEWLELKLGHLEADWSFNLVCGAIVVSFAWLDCRVKP